MGCNTILEQLHLLPPAYVVRGKVIFILGNVCLFTFGGGGYPIPIHPCPGRGGTRSSLGWGGGGGYLIQPWTGGGVPQPWMGGWYPISGGVPHPMSRGIPWVPPPARDSKHLLRLRGGRCASCVQAGGLSCLN